jgi:hypothetical protein
VLIVRDPLNRISALSRQTLTFQTPSKVVPGVRLVAGEEQTQQAA